MYVDKLARLRCNVQTNTARVNPIEEEKTHTHNTQFTTLMNDERVK